MNKTSKKYSNLLKKYRLLESKYKALLSQETKEKEKAYPILYTDGGYNKWKKVGAWAFGTEEKVIDSGLITDIDGTWNIQSEITACINAIKYAESKNYTNVLIVHDLKGLKYWYEGRWKANFNCTKALKALRGQVKVNVAFKLVKGHAGVKGNELVDSQCQQIIANF